MWWESCVILSSPLAPFSLIHLPLSYSVICPLHSSSSLLFCNLPPPFIHLLSLAAPPFRLSCSHLQQSSYFHPTSPSLYLSPVSSLSLSPSLSLSDPPYLFVVGPGSAGWLRQPSLPSHPSAPTEGTVANRSPCIMHQQPHSKELERVPIPPRTSLLNKLPLQQELAPVGNGSYTDYTARTAAAAAAISPTEPNVPTLSLSPPSTLCAQVQGSGVQKWGLGCTSEIWHHSECESRVISWKQSTQHNTC